jgi:hypothetical protein
MAWDGMSRLEIELELRERIERRRGDYQRVLDEQRQLMNTLGDAGPNADGMLALHQLRRTRDALHEAVERYKSSTQAFGEYVLHGKLPRDE